MTDILLTLQGDPNRRALSPTPARRRGGRRSDIELMPRDELERLIQSLEEEMHEAAKDLRFEYAARLRDEIHDLKRELREVS